MRLTVALLVLCVLAAGTESRSVTGHQRSQRNLLTSAISGIQNAVEQAVSSVLNAGGTLVHNTIGVVENTVEGAVAAAEHLAENLVHHNSFAVNILQCLAGAANRTAQEVADAADNLVDDTGEAIFHGLHIDGEQAAAASKTSRDVLGQVGVAVLGQVAGAVRDCVVGALHHSVQELQGVAKQLVGNVSSVTYDALEAIEQVIEKDLQNNPDVLKTLDSAIKLSEQVVKNLTQQADNVVDGVAHEANDVVDSVANSTGNSRSARNVLDDLMAQMKKNYAENLAKWINNTTALAEKNVEELIAHAEQAANEALLKAHQAVDDHVIQGSDWEKALDTLLQNAKNAEQQLANNAEGAVDSAVKVAHEIAQSISSSQ